MGVHIVMPGANQNWVSYLLDRKTEYVIDVIKPTEQDLAKWGWLDRDNDGFVTIEDFEVAIATTFEIPPQYNKENVYQLVCHALSNNGYIGYHKQPIEITSVKASAKVAKGKNIHRDYPAHLNPDHIINDVMFALTHGRIINIRTAAQQFESWEAISLGVTGSKLPRDLTVSSLKINGSAHKGSAYTACHAFFRGISFYAPESVRAHANQCLRGELKAVSHSSPHGAGYVLFQKGFSTADLEPEVVDKARKLIRRAAEKHSPNVMFIETDGYVGMGACGLLQIEKALKDNKYFGEAETLIRNYEACRDEDRRYRESPEYKQRKQKYKESWKQREAGERARQAEDVGYPDLW